MISRNEKEKVLIEGSINSVRVSIAVKQVTNKLLLSQHGWCVGCQIGKDLSPNLAQSDNTVWMAIVVDMDQNLVLSQ